MKIDPNAPAFPFFDATENGYGNAVVLYDATGAKQILPFSPGLSIRTKIASEQDVPWTVIENVLRDKKGANPTVEEVVQGITKVKLMIADALIAELNKEQP